MISTIACCQIASAQDSVDSSAEALLDHVDDPPADATDLFDELESILDGTRVSVRTRLGADVNPHDQAGAVRNLYVGSPYASLARIRAHSETFLLGLAAQKDSWERRWTDDWTGFIGAQNLPAGPLVVSAVAGSYSLNLGSGLLFGSGLGGVAIQNSPGRFSAPHSLLRSALSPHGSTSLLGAATSASFGSLKVLPFFSSRQLDARVDSIGVRSVYTYYHRTDQEESYRDALNERVAGAHLSWTDSALGLSTGATYYRLSYDRPLMTESAYRALGSSLTQLGADAAWRSTAFDLAAEWAASNSTSSGTAYLAQLGVHATDRLRLLAIYEHADTNYYAPFGATPIEGTGEITNRSAAWLGLEAHVATAWLVSSGLQLTTRVRETTALLPAPKSDAFIELATTELPATDLQLRYRRRLTEQNQSLITDGRTVTVLDARDQSNLRLIATSDLAPEISVQIRAEATQLLHSTGASSQSGIDGQLRLTYHSQESSIRIAVARFSTQSYDSRLYGYAPEVAGAGSILTFNGTGYFALASFRRILLDHISIEGYFGGYFYDHARTIGAGLTERSDANDLNVMFQLSFTL